MIAFFPEPYPDELAYSLFARYHVHSGHLTFRATAEDLFQNKDAIPNPEFFAPLSEEVCNILTRNSTMETFIAEHTMLPYYIRFLPLERRRKAMNLLLAMDRTFYDAIYVRQKKSERRQHMRYCPLCATADREQHGETYWHRKHQLPGVEICLEHRCRLENSSNGITVESQRFKLVHAELVIPQYTPVNLDVSDLEHQLSDYVMQVFSADMDFDNDVSTGKFLQSRLEKTPYTSLVNGQIALVEDELRDLFDSWSWGYSCYTLDGDGKIIKVQWRKGSAHDYHDKGEEANQIVGLCTPTYDAEGKKISESISFDGINVDKTITYKYDEKGRLVEIKTDNYAILYEYNDQGLLASKEKHHVINKEYWLDEFIYSYDNNGLLCSTAYAKCKLNNNNVFEEYTLADYTYVCDENGRIVSSTKTYRKDSRENPGCVYQSDFVYGDYYIFNPNNN